MRLVSAVDAAPVRWRHARPPGHRRSRECRDGAAIVATPARSRTRRRRRKLARSSGANRRLRGALAAHRPSPGRPRRPWRKSKHRKTAVEGAIADGSLSGVEVETCHGSRWRTATGSRSSTRPRPTVSSTIPIDGGAHGLALVTGIEDDQAVRTSRHARRAGLRSHRRWRRQREGRPGERRTASAPGPRHADRLRRRDASMVHVLGPRRRTRHAGRLDGLRDRAARQCASTPTRGCRDDAAGAWAMDVE